MKKTFLALVGLVTLCLAQPGQAGPNLISNGEFDTPSVPSGFQAFFGGSSIGPWLVVGSGYTDIIAPNDLSDSSAAPTADAGDQFLYLSDHHSSTPMTIQQSVTLAAGSKYSLSYEMGAWSGVGGSMYVNVLDPNGTTSAIGGQQTVTLPSSSFTFSPATPATFTAPVSGSYTVEFTGSWAFGDGALLDNVALEAISSPVPDSGMTAGLLGLAMAGLGFMRRKI